ncbi:acetyltransferase [Flagellimonas marina]|jgi:sugar O-acyltransferase (sialic acid O-acetyltransferase NeuD family)|uniref:Acetyltransferase n=1 Tax=Flagellimonas marina TaxID=1775168 RepID=A0ABV8PMS3_9FLAO
MNNAIIIGAGTHGQIYASYLAEEGINVIGFVDDNEHLFGQNVIGIPVIGKVKDLANSNIKSRARSIYCPIGNNTLRQHYLMDSKKMGYETPSFFHRTAVIGPDVKMGEANYVLAGSIIMPHTTIGDFFMINMSTTIGHHVQIGHGVFMSSGVNVGANLIIEDHAYIGIGATIMTGLGTIGKGSLIGAGSVVIKTVAPNTVVVGNPAREIPKK